MLRDFAAATIAFASGCSLYCSALAARRRTSSSVAPFSASMRVTIGLPFVIVPV
jgi:hypothetical protein